MRFRIIGSKKKGHIGVGMIFVFFLLILMIIGMSSLEIYFLNLKAERTQDDIVFSNLAAYKDIDKMALAETPQILKISEPNKAYNTFLTYLKKNMSLDNNLNGMNNSIAVGKVNIKTFIIYNIIGNQAEIYTLDINTNVFNKSDISNITSNPIIINGTKITNTSIYTVININYEVMLKGILGNTRNTDVIALTDIKH